MSEFQTAKPATRRRKKEEEGGRRKEEGGRRKEEGGRKKVKEKKKKKRRVKSTFGAYATLAYSHRHAGQPHQSRICSSGKWTPFCLLILPYKSPEESEPKHRARVTSLLLLLWLPSK